MSVYRTIGPLVVAVNTLTIKQNGLTEEKCLPKILYVSEHVWDLYISILMVIKL